MKNIVAFDVETTGLNKQEDFIIQLSAIKFTPNFEILDQKNWYILPIHKFRIAPAALETHGITEEFLKTHGQSMSVVGPEFVQMCEGCDLLTYNGNKFDIQFVIKDLAMVGIKFDIENRVLYDAYALECRLYSRTLSEVYKRRTGMVLEGAHDAMNDIKATISVFQDQIREIGAPLEEISKFDECNIFCIEGSLRRANKPNKDEMIVFNYGKYKDSEFIHVCKIDPSYIKWFMTTIGEGTKRKLREYYIKYKDIYS
jgi:DNA polymerase-3 subunit epsilon